MQNCEATRTISGGHAPTGGVATTSAESEADAVGAAEGAADAGLDAVSLGDALGPPDVASPQPANAKPTQRTKPA